MNSANSSRVWSLVMTLALPLPAAVIERAAQPAGGRSGPSDFGDVYIYEPATDRWTSGPSIEPRGTAGDDVYVVGGSELPGSSHSSAGSTIVERFRQVNCPRRPPP